MKNQIHLVIAALIVSSLLLTGCGRIGDDTIRVATDATWPPFEMVDEETKELVGLDIDLMNAIAIKAGFEVEFVNVTFDTLLFGMAQCRYDAAISAMTITPDRAADFNFSTPYFNAGQVVVVRFDNMDITGFDDLANKIVGVQMDTTGDIEAQKISGATVRRYDDIGLAFQDLMNGQLEALIADYPMALGVVGQYPELIKIAGDIFTDESYGIAICKTNEELMERINTALAELIDEGYITGLTQIWIIGGE